MTIDYRTSQIFLVFQRKTVQSGLNPGLFAPLTAGQSGDWTRTDGFEISTSVEVGSAGSGASDGQLSNLNLTTYAFSINNNSLTTFRDFGSNSVITRSIGLTAVPNALYLGIRRDGPSLNYPSDVYFGEALVYNRLLSTSEYQQVEGYLAKKWGLSGGGIQTITPFTPTSVAGCAVWLDAADSNSLTLSGSSITQVRDKSSNGYVFSNASGFTYNDVKFNGSYPSFYTATTSTSSLGSNTSISLSQPMTFFTVCQMTNTTNGGYIFDSTSAGNRMAFIAYGGGKPVMFAGVELSNAVTTTFTSPGLHGGVFNGSSSLMFSNGTQSASGNAGTQGATGLIIGARYTLNQNWVGHICELLIYNGVLTTTDRQNIEGYLARKWGLTSSLPSTHPYALRGLPTTHLYYSIPPMTRGFAPVDIPGLQLWLDAADPNSLTLSGTSVTSWRDKSSNNYSSTVYNSPTYSNNSLNGLPGVTFNGSSQYISFGNIINLGTSPIYVFSVVKYDTTGDGTIIAKSSYRANTGRWFMTRAAVGGGAIMGVDIGSGGVTASFADTTTNVQLFSGFWDRSTVYVFQNGTQRSSIAAVNSSSLTNTDPLYIAAYPNGTGTAPNTIGGYTYLNGKIGEILVYNESITTAQRQQIEGYLARKWGLASIQASPPLPTTISGINAWYDGADPLGTGVPPSVNTTLGTWYDKSGNGRNASGGVSPTFVSGGVSFNGSSSYLNMSIPYSSNYSIFLVATNTSVSQVYFFGRDSIGGGREPTFIQGYIGAGIGLEWYESSDRGTIATTPSSPFIASIDHTQGSSIQGYYFGTQSFNISQTRTYFSNAWDTLGRPGAGTAAGWYGGIMKELIFFSNTLTTTQRQNVEGYLALKWGLQSSLPSTHPYALRGLPSTHPFISRMPATTVFNPRQIANCGLWLDAADPSTFTYQSGSNVSIWTDKTSGIQAQYSVAAGSVNYPVSGSNINGRNALFFNQSSLLATLTQSVTTRSYFAVLQILSPNTNPDGNILWPGTTVGGFARGGSISVNSSNIVFANQNVANLLNLAYTVGSPLILSITFNNGTVGMWNTGGGTTSSTGQSSSVLGFSGSTDNIIYIGGVGGVYTSSGFLLGEFLEYNAALSTRDRQQVEGYLAWKWGLNGGYSPSIAPFTPTSVAGCQLWLDAADSSTLTLSGSSVTQWNDKSGNQRNFNQPTSGSRPTYVSNGLNNYPIVRFASAFLSNVGFPLYASASSGMSFFAVFNTTNRNQQTAILAQMWNGTNFTETEIGFSYASGTGYSLTNYGSIGLHRGNGAVTQTASNAINSNVTYVYSAIASNTGSTPSSIGLFLNGTQNTSIDFNTGMSNGFYSPGSYPIFLNSVYLGARNDRGPINNYLAGDIAELILYNTVISSTQRQQIEGYLALKWGLTGSLPSSHPYANRSLPSTHPYKLIKP